MVAIFTGTGTGLERGSGSILGSRGLVGAAATGRAAENIFVNAASGNLVISARDEILVGRGADNIIYRTYNSLGQANDDNGDNWANYYAAVTNHVGTINSAGAYLDRNDEDGGTTRYYWDGAVGAYVSKDGGGAHDRIGHDGVNWWWQDGDSGIKEVYGAAYNNRLISRTDRDGNAIRYLYESAGGKLVTIATADGNYTNFTWSGNNLIMLTTTYTDVTTGTNKNLLRTRYAYDSQNRLTTVWTDLSPEDNSIVDGRVYTTNYSYVGASKLVASITQTDGTRLEFAYDGANRVTSFTQWVDASTVRTTSFSYGAGYTYITDAQGNITTTYYDGAGRLTYLREPEATAGGNPKITQFDYDGDGNLSRQSTYDGWTNQSQDIIISRIWYRYDAKGNLYDSYTDLAGNGYEVVRYSYGNQNELLTSTTYTGFDLDGHVGADPTGALTTRYAYDSKTHLRFMISPEGRVTEYRYDGYGQRVSEIQYVGNSFASPSTPVSLAEAESWVAGADKSQTTRTDYGYDFRGNLATDISYIKVLANGVGDGASGFTQNQYVYDQAGQLLSRYTFGTPANEVESYAYDGMGRVIRHTDKAGVGTWTSFIDAQNRTVTTLANGLMQTSAYNRAGELMSSSEARGGVVDERIPDDLPLWGYSGVTRTAVGKVDGADAYKYSVLTAGQWSAAYAGFAAKSGETISWSISLMAVEGASKDQNLGLYGDMSFWGADNISSARIISGPGTLSQLTGGVWRISGLSSTEATRIEIVRHFLQAETGGAYLYVDASSAGQELIASAPTITRSRYDTSVTNQTLRAGEITTWASGGVSVADAGTLGGSAARQYTVQTNGNWSAVYSGFTIEAGDSYTFAASFKAVAGSDTTQDFGLYSDMGDDWGWNDEASARIISGPGTLIQLRGGLWRIAGLSSTQDTRLEITRSYRKSGTGGMYVYIDATNGHRAGQSLIVGATTVTRTPGSITSYKYDSLGRLRVKVDPVGVRSFYFYDRAGRMIGEVDQDGSIAEYKYDAADRRVASVRYATALSAAQVASLHDSYSNPSAVEFSAIRPAASADDRWSWSIYDRAGKLIETIDAVGATVEHIYDGAGQLSYSWRRAYKLTQAQIDGLKATPPSTKLLPPNNAAEDRIFQYYYDKDGLQIGTMDEEGYLTQIIYDKAGRKIETVRFNNLPNLANRLTDSFSTLLTSAGTSAVSDIHNYWVYDGRGFVVATIDGEGNVTRYAYTPTGKVSQEVRGQQVPANSSYTMASLPAPSGILEVTNYTYNGRQELIQRQRLLAGGQVETTSYTYDSVGNQLSETVSETVSSETRTNTNRYDAKGRLIGTLGGIGSWSLSTYGANPTQAQIDSHYIIYGTRYSYDAADRLISKITPDGSGGAGNKTLYYYDSDGQLRYEVNPLGEVTEHRYTALEDKSDTIVYGTRMAAGTLATLTGGLVTATITNAVAAIANSALDSRSQYLYTVRGELNNIYNPLYTVNPTDSNRSFYYFNSFGELSTEHNTQNTAGWDVHLHGFNRRGLKYYDYNYLNGAYAGSVQSTYYYDAFGRVVNNHQNNTDWRGVSYNYDRANRRTTEWEHVGHAGSYRQTGYDARDNQISYRDRTGKTTTFAYDLFNRNVTTTTPEGVVSSVRKNAYGQTIQISDGAGRTTSYSYDKNGNLKTVTDAAGTVTNNYDNADRLIEVVDARGVKTRYSYDAVGRMLTEVRDYGGINATTTHAYDAKGQEISVTDARGAVTSFSYDLKGQKVSVVQDVGGLGIVTNYQYRADGKLVRMVEAAGSAAERRTDYSYDSMGRLIEQRVDLDGLNQATSYVYDNNNNVVAITDARGFKSRFVFDVENRQILAVSAGGEVVETGYDAEGRVTWVRSYANRISSAAVDGFASDVTEATVRAYLSPDPARDRITRTVYDGDGRKVYAIDGEAYVTRFQYDGANNIIKTVAYANRYGGATNATGRADLDAYFGSIDSPPSEASVTRFAYDSANRLISTTDAEGISESYQYDAVGNRVAVINRLGGRTDFGYDNLNRLSYEYVHAAVYDLNGAQTAAGYYKSTYGYDDVGNLVGRHEAYGLAERRTTLFAYDKLGRLTSKTLPPVLQFDPPSGGDTLVTPVETYQYDARGNLILTIDPAGAKTFSYYDADNRKIAEISPVGQYKSWSYDGQGHVLIERIWGTLVALPAVAGGAAPAVPGGESRQIHYVYDRNGRQTERRIPGLHLGAWNGAAYVSAAGQTAVFTTAYDAFGNMVQETDGNGNSSYHWYDRNGREVQKLDAEGYVTTWVRDEDGNVSREHRYATRFTGSPTAVTVPTSSADRITNFTYDKNGRRLTETRVGVGSSIVSEGGALAAGLSDATIRYSYNSLDQVIRKTEANGDLTEYNYDNQGRLTWQRDPGATDHNLVTVHHRTWFFYDGLGNLVRSAEQAVDPNHNYASGYSWGDDRITRYEYGAGGRLRNRWDANGVQTSYQYDVMGRLRRQNTHTIRSSGEYLSTNLSYGYDLAGRVVEQSHSDYYGNSGWQWTIPFQYSSYNAYGEVASKSVGAVVQEQFQYDAAGRLIKTTAGDGVWKLFGYDANGNQTIAITSAGYNLSGETFASALALVGQENVNATYSVYDKRNMAVQMIEEGRRLSAAGALTTISRSQTYNGFGEMVSETDARGFTTNYSYNAMGRMTQRQSPFVDVTSENGATSTIRPTETYAYDISGRLIGTQDANGWWTTKLLLAGTGHVANGNEALTTKEFRADGSVWETRYDAFHDARMMRDGLGRITTQQFDKLGQITQIIRPATAAGQLVENFSYDGLARRIRHWNNALGAAEVETSDYDALGRAIASRAFGGDVTTTGYVWNGALVTSGVGNFGGWVQTTTYANGLTAISHEDGFGRELWKKDLGGHVFTSSFDSAGRQTSRSTIGGYQGFSYFNGGQLAGISGTNGAASYAYDAAGNRIADYGVSASGAVIQNATATYDALGRLSHWAEAGSATTPAASADYRYDAVGNIRNIRAAHSLLDGNGGTQSFAPVTDDYWYRFDALNRVVVDKGALENGQIVKGSGGSEISYNEAGERATVTRTASLTGAALMWVPGGGDGGGGIVYIEPGIENGDGQWEYVPVQFSGERRETFAYDAAGRLASVYVAESGFQDNGDGTVSATPIVGSGGLRGSFSYDLLGRLTQQADYGGALGYAGATHSRSLAYNLKGQIISEDDSTVKQQYGNNLKDIFRNITSYSYGTGTSYALGSIVSQSVQTFKNNNNSDAPDTSTTNNYVWWDGAVVSSISFDSNSGSNSNPIYYSYYSYNGLGVLSQVAVNDGIPKTLSYSNDALGQIVRRDESRNSQPYGPAPHEIFYRFGGRQVGMIGNNGTAAASYHESVKERSQATAPVTSSNAGIFRGGINIGGSVADFSQSLDAITSYEQGSAGSSYSVNSGDTLQSIALGVYGDANLWYKIAEANGLSANAALIEGQNLILPAGISRSSHNANSFSPYNASEAIGDTSPTNAKPPKKPKCGLFAQILSTVVALAANYFLGPIGGNIVSQGFNNLIGTQSGFSFKSVALAAISQGVSQGLSGLDVFARTGFGAVTNVANNVARAALSSALTQGIGVASGLQRKFSWAEVAAAGVSAGVGSALNVPGISDTNRSIGAYAANLGAAGASLIASAATRSLVEGSNFGDNILAGLPNVIGQTIGNAIIHGVSGNARAPRVNSYAGSSAGGTQSPDEPSLRSLPIDADTQPIAGDSLSLDGEDIIVTAQPNKQWSYDIDAVGYHLPSIWLRAWRQSGQEDPLNRMLATARLKSDRHEQIAREIRSRLIEIDEILVVGPKKSNSRAIHLPKSIAVGTIPSQTIGGDDWGKWYEEYGSNANLIPYLKLNGYLGNTEKNITYADDLIARSDPFRLERFVLQSFKDNVEAHPEIGPIVDRLQTHVDDLNAYVREQIDKPLGIIIGGSALLALGAAAFPIAGTFASEGTVAYYTIGGGIGSSSNVSFTELQFQADTDPNKRRKAGDYISSAIFGAVGSAGFQPVSAVSPRFLGAADRYVTIAANNGIYGGSAAFLGQEINSYLGYGPISWSDVGRSTVFAAGTGMLTFSVPGLTTGNNNWNARFQGRLTARNNGYVNNIRFITSARAAVANNIEPVTQNALATGAEIIAERRSGP